MRFKNILSELLIENVELLVENDNRDKIKKVFGFNDAWVDEFHRINPKMSIWVADSFIKDASQQLNKSPKDLINTLNKKGNNNIPTDVGLNLGEIWAKYRTSYAYIFDWFVNVNTGGRLNLKTLTFREALTASEEWHQNREANISNKYKEKNEIVIDYRSNGIGYYWANLNTSKSEEEGDRMGHCGNKFGTTLFSLRGIDENGDGRSFVTLAMDSNGIVSEVHAKKNTKPKQIFIPYIIDFLINKKHPVKGLTLKNVYRPEENFQLEDLTPEVLNDLFEKNKDIKYNYVFGDTQIISYLQDSNKEIALVNRKRQYGIVNVSKVEIIKAIEYEMDYESDFTEFIMVNGNNLLIRHYKNANGKNFITLADFVSKGESQQFELIPLKTAKKLIQMDKKNEGN